MPLVQIKWFKGRDRVTKAKTIELGMVAVSEAFGCSKFTLINESKRTKMVY
jgi:phenylpyruvate tautomerase PptA (4-oxalocrotonate tautomerase family)